MGFRTEGESHIQNVQPQVLPTEKKVEKQEQKLTQVGLKVLNDAKKEVKTRDVLKNKSISVKISNVFQKISDAVSKKVESFRSLFNKKAQGKDKTPQMEGRRMDNIAKNSASRGSQGLDDPLASLNTEEDRSVGDILETPLGIDVLNLANKSEEIKNTGKNLDLKFVVPPGKTVEEVADEMIETIRKATTEPSQSDIELPDPKKLEKKGNKSSFAKLDDYFKGIDSKLFKAALIDLLASKKAENDGVIHISNPLKEAISKMETQKEANLIGEFLMSEVAESGVVRKLNLDKFEKLLNHPDVKGSEMLTKAVLNAGRKVQVEALRTTQEHMVWDMVGGKPGRPSWNKWVDMAKQSSGNFDRDGIDLIAKKAGILLPNVAPDDLVSLLEELVVGKKRLDELHQEASKRFSKM